MSAAESYQTLPPDALTQRLEVVTDQYWNALEFLANITAERALLMNLVKERTPHE